MPIVDTAVERIIRISDSDTRRVFARALYDSLIWEGFPDGALPRSAESLVNDYGIDAAALHDNMVLLSKKAVVEYARDIGRTMTIEIARKRITEGTYRSTFDDGRAAVRASRMLLITYAEARVLCGVRSKGLAPPALESMVQRD